MRTRSNNIAVAAGLRWGFVSLGWAIRAPTIGSQPLAAQEPSPLTVAQAFQQALDKYPAVRSSLEQVSAAAAGINLARRAYLPRADFLGQANRATP